jgi:hypothetical protein
MTDKRPVYTRSSRWKTAYRAAILETNRSAVFGKVSDAVEAIACRVHQLFEQSGAEAEAEKEALDDATYILGALKNAVQPTGSTAQPLVSRQAA